MPTKHGQLSIVSVFQLVHPVSIHSFKGIHNQKKKIIGLPELTFCKKETKRVNSVAFENCDFIISCGWVLTNPKSI